MWPWGLHLVQRLDYLNGIKLTICISIYCSFYDLTKIIRVENFYSNEKSIVQDNGFIVPEKNYLFMVSLHSTWLVAILYMAIWRWSESNLSIFLIGLVLFLCGQTLRIIAIKTLGSRWTTRITILPEKPAINKGVFKYLRHPNYLGVCLEILRSHLWRVFSMLQFSFLL